jgi:hypothetical protein
MAESENSNNENLRNPNILRSAGDITVEKIVITSSKGVQLDVVNQMMQIQIFEDMFQTFTSGNIVLDDSLDLINFFPFIGEEYLELDLRTPTFDEDGKKITGRFYIYKMTDRYKHKEKAVYYTLHFISIEALVDMNIRFSKAFEGSPSELVEQLVSSTDGMRSTKKIVIKEPTTNKIKFIASNWNPSRCLLFVTKAAQNDLRSNYLFFENRDGFVFATPNYLYGTQPVAQNFTYTARDRDIATSGSSTKDLNYDFTRIHDYKLPVGFNFIDRVASGMYGSRMTTHDLVTKKYSSTVYYAPNEWEKHPHLNDYPIWSKNLATSTSAVQVVEQKHYGIYNGYGDITNTKNNLSRISMMQQFEGFKLQIKVSGRTDYTVGMKVTVKLPSLEPAGEKDSSQTIEDKMFSGNYIVAAINHNIRPDKHECYMELVKDSLIFDLNKGA